MTDILIIFVLSIILMIMNGVIGTILNKQDFCEYNNFSFATDERRFDTNFFFKIFNPTIYISILSAIFQKINHIDFCRKLWIVVPMYWATRILFLTITNKIVFADKKKEFIAFIYSILIMLVVYIGIILPLIDENESIFISREELRDGVWFAIIAYVVKVLWDIYKTNLSFKNVYSQERLEKVVIERYVRLSRKYDDVINENLKINIKQFSEQYYDIYSLIYALMIFEDYNRPKVYRILENALIKLRIKKQMSLGIMQVKSDKYITDEESIIVAVKRIITYYTENTDDQIYYTIQRYNNYGNNYEEIYKIYITIWSYVIGDECNIECAENIEL